MAHFWTSFHNLGNAQVWLRRRPCVAIPGQLRHVLDCKQSSSCSVETPGTLPVSLHSDSSVGQYGTDFKQLQRTKNSSLTQSPSVSFLGLVKPCQLAWPDSWGSPVSHHQPQNCSIKSMRYLSHMRRSLGACTNGDVRRVFHRQRHAKLSTARLHGATLAQTDGDSITSTRADGVSHTHCTEGYLSSLWIPSCALVQN